MFYAVGTFPARQPNPIKEKSIMSKSQRPQRGFSLLEVALVLVVILLGAGAILSAYTGTKSAADANNESKNINTILAGVKRIYAGTRGYTGLANTVLINGGGAPTNMISGTNLTNAYGGAVTVAPTNISGGTNNAFTITYAGVPGPDCTALVNQVSQTFSVIVVGTTNVKTLAAPQLDVPGLTTACSGGGNSNTIVFTAT
jgi:prepilin-type N-terminal cleavage/methylation domain-containing protein